jgi:hypothetical protein
MGCIYLIAGRAEIDRRRLLSPGMLIEAWPDLHAGDLFWLGDDERRRAEYTAAARERPRGGWYWIGETSKAALEGTGQPLAWDLAVDESLVPIYYGPWLTDADSLPAEDSIRARALSAHAIAVAWSTRDGSGTRIEHQPASPLDLRFPLRRAGSRVLHLFDGFRTKASAVAAMEARRPDDPEACAWAGSLAFQDFAALMHRAVSPSHERRNQLRVLTGTRFE